VELYPQFPDNIGLLKAANAAFLAGISILSGHAIQKLWNFAVVEAMDSIASANWASQDLRASTFRQRLFRNIGGTATLYVCDCRQLPFDDSSKDIVIVQGCLHHLKTLPDDLQRTLSEAARVLKDNGAFVVIEPWLTNFLAFVHMVCRSRIARRVSPKIDALATMIDYERETYEQWLGQPQTIVRLLEQFFFTDLCSIKWGKYMYIGRKRNLH
jgi:SAM-dependent methyltransferase